MSELHNTNPVNYMQRSFVAKALIWGGGKNGLDNGMSKAKWGPGRRLNKLELLFWFGDIQCLPKVLLECLYSFKNFYLRPLSGALRRMETPFPLIICWISSQDPYIFRKASLIPIVLVICPPDNIVLKGRGFVVCL